MKFVVPWDVKDLAPDARETASEAARRSGMPVAEWLNSVIIDSAAGAGVVPKRAPRDETEEHRVKRRPGSYMATDEDLHWGSPREDSLAAVTERLDALTQQLERLARYQNANG